MSAKAIYEAAGKELLYRELKFDGLERSGMAEVEEGVDWTSLQTNHPWLTTQKLVAKPDQLIKRRGKLGLIAVNKDFNDAKNWILERLGKEVQVEKAKGKLKHFLIEPFLPHSDSDEMYVCIYSGRHSDSILFHHQGGVDIGDVDAKAVKLEVPVGTSPSLESIERSLLLNVAGPAKELVGRFVLALYTAYVDLFFTYLEINPLVVKDSKVYILDLAAKIDATAEFLAKAKWANSVRYPAPFGREALPEEAYIEELDSKSGASLKLTILNKNGRIWTMVAGGGASVIYSDTICDQGGASELANYGEYSGAPSEIQTYEYAKTLLSLMTQGEPRTEGKVLIIGGSIANFTNVAATFKGIVRALQDFRELLVRHSISVFVRRGGPNYQEGLRVMKEVGGSLGIPVHVFGPETHMTAVVAMALGKRPVPDLLDPHHATTTASFMLGGSAQVSHSPLSSSLSHTPQYAPAEVRLGIVGFSHVFQFSTAHRNYLATPRSDPRANQFIC